MLHIVLGILLIFFSFNFEDSGVAVTYLQKSYLFTKKNLFAEETQNCESAQGHMACQLPGMKLGSAGLQRAHSQHSRG